VRGIKARFVRRFAISAFIEQLRAHKIALTGFFESSGADNVELVTEMARCEANLRSAARHLDRMASRDAREALRLIKGGSAADLYAIYIAVVRLLQSLENASAEQEVSSYVE
jgi:hypothetical protein